MAATNPFRVSDLIAKYGWKVMPYLSNLGPTLLAEAQVLFVDSGHTNTLDADDTEHGHSFEKPLATIDYAIGLCTAAERSVILAAPGHTDTLGDAQIDFDVSDITVIGIGEGSNKPKIVFGHANSSVDIGANNVHLNNLRFVPSITSVVIGVDIETTVTGTIIENCEFAEGDDIAADEFITALAVKATCTDTRVTNCLFRTGLAADGAVEAIKLTGISDNVIIEKSRFIGNWSAAGIYNDSGVCTDLLIDDCTMKVADGLPGISVVSTTTGIIRNVCIESSGLAVDSMIVAADMSWFNNYGVTVDGTAAEIIGGGEAVASIIAYNLDHLAKTADGGTNYPTQVTTDSILGMLMATAGNPNTFVKGTDSLQAIRDYVAGTTSLDGINLDHLALTAAGGTNYPTTVTAQSILGMIMGTTGDPATFVKGTDSLQAIADHVQTLMTTAVGSDVYPSGITNESILAYLMSKSTTPAASSFNNETDSLEAISDQVSKLDSITIDTTPVAASLATYLAGGAGGVGTQLPTSTSLYDTTKNLSVVGVTGAPVAQTLADTLHKDGSFTYDNQYDSLEAIGDKARDIRNIAYPDLGTIFYVDGFNGSNSNDGLSPETPVLTITYALGLVSNAANDYIIILAYYQASGETWPIVVNKEKVHIIGPAVALKSGAYHHQWITPATDNAAFEVTKSYVEIAGLDIAAGAAHAGIEVPLAAGTIFGLTIHDCSFGDEQTAQDGIKFIEGSDAAETRIWGNFFGKGLTRDGIRLEASITRGHIGLFDKPRNIFREVAGIAINVVKTGTDLGGICNNLISLPSDTAGKGITFPSVHNANCTVAGNDFCFGRETLTVDPIADSATTKNNYVNNTGGLASTLASVNPLLGRRVQRTKSDIMDGSAGVGTAVFTIAGGEVLITALYGVIQDGAHDATADACKFSMDGTNGTSTDLCATSDLASKEQYTMISIDGTAATALVVASSGSIPSAEHPVICAPGSIRFISAGDGGDGNSATLELDLWYFPLDDGATVVVA